MILIADSGSTKTDWVLIHTKPDLSEPSPQETFVSSFHTQGINPVYMSEQDIVDVFDNELKAQFPSDVPFDYSMLKVRFYGAGCREDMIPKMQSAFARSLHTDDKNIEVYSDMMGAARALCGNQEGIACILGTGSNSCLYDGQRIESNISPMGFILGDEGSGAVLGKCFLNLLYKGEVCQSLKDDFIQQTQLSMSDIINKVYRAPLPNRFLASLVPFIHQHLHMEEVRQMVIDNFRQFFVKNIRHYQSPQFKVHFVGSVAYYFADCLREAASIEGYEIGEICQSPIEGLVKYHQNNN